MRPIERGACPQINGVDKIVADYKDWRQDLLDTIGNYCSYCNMVLNDSPQVEHVIPKIPQVGQVAGDFLSWDNMLLACGPCNRTKDNKPNTVLTHYIPDSHNTHLAFNYVVIDHPNKINQKACITVPENSPLVNLIKAQNTIDLCGLNALTYNRRATDLRWKYRFEAWHSANVIWRQNWNNWGHGQPDAFTDLLVDAAVGKGFFSVWFEAFNDISIVKQRLIEGFLGTHQASFNPMDDYNPVVRIANDL